MTILHWIVLFKFVRSSQGQNGTKKKKNQPWHL